MGQSINCAFMKGLTGLQDACGTIGDNALWAWRIVHVHVRFRPLPEVIFAINFNSDNDTMSPSKHQWTPSDILKHVDGGGTVKATKISCLVDPNPSKSKRMRSSMYPPHSVTVPALPKEYSAPGVPRSPEADLKFHAVWCKQIMTTMLAVNRIFHLERHIAECDGGGLLLQEHDPAGVLTACATGVRHFMLGSSTFFPSEGECIATAAAIGILAFQIKSEQEVAGDDEKAMMNLVLGKLSGLNEEQRNEALPDCVKDTRRKMLEMLNSGQLWSVVEGNVGVETEWRIQDLRDKGKLSDKDVVKMLGITHFLYRSAVQNNKVDVLKEAARNLRTGGRGHITRLSQAFVLASTLLLLGKKESGVKFDATDDVIASAWLLLENARVATYTDFGWCIGGVHREDTIASRIQPQHMERVCHALKRVKRLEQ